VRRGPHERPADPTYLHERPPLPPRHWPLGSSLSDLPRHQRDLSFLPAAIVYNRAMTADGAIVLSTFSSLARHGYEMGVYCQSCERRVTIDLAAFSPELSHVGRQLRCSCVSLN